MKDDPVLKDAHKQHVLKGLIKQTNSPKGMGSLARSECLLEDILAEDNIIMEEDDEQITTQ